MKYFRTINCKDCKKIFKKENREKASIIRYQIHCICSLFSVPTLDCISTLFLAFNKYQIYTYFTLSSRSVHWFSQKNRSMIIVPTVSKIRHSPAADASRLECYKLYFWKWYRFWLSIETLITVPWFWDDPFIHPDARPRGVTTQAPGVRAGFAIFAGIASLLVFVSLIRTIIRWSGRIISVQYIWEAGTINQEEENCTQNLSLNSWNQAEALHTMFILVILFITVQVFNNNIHTTTTIITRT